MALSDLLQGCSNNKSDTALNCSNKSDIASLARAEGRVQFEVFEKTEECFFMVEKIYYYLLIIHTKKIIQNLSHVHVHARNARNK